MAKQIYNVKLFGKSQVHEPEVILEDISINLWSIDGGQTWENKNAEVDVSGQLQIEMSCKAVSGTSWKFIIINKLLNSKVLDDSGQTGDQGTVNYSKRNYNVNP